MKTLALVFLLAGAAEGAGPPKAAIHVKAELFASGQEAVLRLTHDPHWHTYWINPGDSGLATSLTPGVLDFPAPERITAGPLTNFGYSGVTLIPAELPEGVRKAKAEWLECADVCVPGKAELTAKPAPPGLLEKARAAAPRTDPVAALGARDRGASVILEIAGRHPLAEFFPAEPGAFESARGSVAVSPDRTALTLDKAPGSVSLERLSGILVRPGLPPVWLLLPIGSDTDSGARNLLLAFLGGLLLNLMPCVFPVLAFKVAGLLERPGRGHALAYTAGVVTSFLALAGGLIAARAAGASLGWGFQLQSPWVVGALAALFMAIGLNLLGFFEVGTRLMSLGGNSGGGAFTSGVFAVVVAAPCTAPFMGAALGWALTRSAWEALPVFAALGLGTAAPYALLSSWPALLKLLPRPGAWMETFKKILAMPMFLTSFWLLWVLYRLLMTPTAVDPLWKTWSPEAVAQARAAGKTTFVDFTAAWCLSCQVNERLVLSRPEVAAALEKGAAFKADWTDKNPVIEAELAKHGRAGVPLYIVYPKGRAAVVLPEILTPGLVLETLGENK